MSNNTHVAQASPEDFEAFSRTTKAYYKEIETYDWVDVTDHFRGLECLFHRNRQRVMCNLLRRYGQGNRYLDVGCGTGLILRHLPSGSVGLDINPRNLPLAAAYARQAHLVLGDAEDIPLATNTFSTVICTEVLEHLPDPGCGSEGDQANIEAQRGADRLSTQPVRRLAVPLPEQHLPPG